LLCWISDWMRQCMEYWTDTGLLYAWCRARDYTRYIQTSLYGTMPRWTTFCLSVMTCKNLF
jgi:hypothetical protein